MDKQEIVSEIHEWPENNSPMKYSKILGWAWSMKFSGEWEIERNNGLNEKDLITRRDWDVKTKGLTRVLLDEALLEIKRLNEIINSQVPREREMGQ